MCETIRAGGRAAGLRLDQIAAIGVATPGTMDIPAGIILDPPNLKPWQNVPVRRHIQRHFRAADGVSERRQRGRLRRILGRRRQRRPQHGAVHARHRRRRRHHHRRPVLEGEHSHGAEVGHMKIEMTNPRPCGCGRWGCLEAYASATAVVEPRAEALEFDDGAIRRCTRRVARTGRAHGAGRLRRGGRRRCPGRKDRRGDGVLSGGRGDEHDAHHRSGHGRFRRRHDRGGRVVSGSHPQPRPASWRFRCRRSRRQICYAQLGSDAGFIGAAACARKLYRSQADRR